MKVFIDDRLNSGALGYSDETSVTDDKSHEDLDKDDDEEDKKDDDDAYR